jgi:hypothetical protein
MVFHDRLQSQIWMVVGVSETKMYVSTTSYIVVDVIHGIDFVIRTGDASAWVWMEEDVGFMP